MAVMSPRYKDFLRMTATAVVAAGVFWLLRDHWRHTAGLLVFAPYLLFLACPLMHLFMGHGHGHAKPPGAGNEVKVTREGTAKRTVTDQTSMDQAHCQKAGGRS